MRDLLNQLSVLNRPFVVGCNSWAWEFLKKAVMAHLLLPPPLTFAPFDYKKLKGWFGHIAEKASEGNINFFNADDRSQFFTETEGSVVQDSYLNTLASESRGIPWIAWNLWRKSLRLERVEKEKRMEDEEEKESEKKKRSVLLGADRGVRVIWVEALASLHFPEEQKVDSLLVLHALLIHSRLTVEELLAVTPNVETTSVVPALLKAGIITLHAKSLMCAPAAYPQVRVHLEDAGFTMDQI
ncbi:MAG: hypothetical protein EOP07_07050 [Proteobacteria bacterium]|nr:MAG: hypothetical protein EOP07_07050 [Pseudomonadota bacterium]